MLFVVVVAALPLATAASKRSRDFTPAHPDVADGYVPRAMANSSLASSPSSAPRVGWGLLLWGAWGLLGLRLLFAVGRGEPFQDNLALVAVVFLIVSAVAASRVYAWFARRREAS